MRGSIPRMTSSVFEQTAIAENAYPAAMLLITAIDGGK
jgi:hypothetical protein